MVVITRLEVRIMMDDCCKYVPASLSALFAHADGCAVCGELLSLSTFHDWANEAMSILYRRAELSGSGWQYADLEL